MEQIATDGVRLERLTANHVTADFDCGDDEINTFLRLRALQGMAQGISTTLVVQKGNRIVGFLTVGLGTVEREQASERFAKGTPAYAQPVLILQRLGVDLSVQGTGLGKVLVLHALAMAVKIAERARQSDDVLEAPIRGLLVVAKDKAKAFYERIGISEASVVDPSMLMILIKDIRKLLDDLHPTAP